MFDCQSLLSLAVDDPAQALVRIWLRLGDHKQLEMGFDRGRLERQAALAKIALERDETPPDVHAFAALRAVDDYLADVVDLNQPPRVRVVAVGEAGHGGEYHLVPRRPGWVSRFSERQAHQPEYWLRRHQVVPADHRGIAVTITELPAHLWNGLQADRMLFAAGGFTDGVHPDWSAPPEALGCSCLKDPVVRRESVERALDLARRRGAKIVVLPELTVDHTVRKALSAWLRAETHSFELVVAGSFYEERKARDDGAYGRSSVARVLDRWGEVVLEHVKLRPMRTMDDGVPIDEGIDGGCSLALLRAPFGLLAVAICLDFCETGAVAVSDLWKWVGPALVLVPSMGSDSTNDAHERRARELAVEHATVTIVASQHPTEAAAAGFCWRPGGAGKAEAFGRLVRRPILVAQIDWTIK